MSLHLRVQMGVRIEFSTSQIQIGMRCFWVLFFYLSSLYYHVILLPFLLILSYCYIPTSIFGNQSFAKVSRNIGVYAINCICITLTLLQQVAVAKNDKAIFITMQIETSGKVYQTKFLNHLDLTLFGVIQGQTMILDKTKHKNMEASYTNSKFIKLLSYLMDV